MVGGLLKLTNWPFSVTKKDLKIQYYRGTGPGGQHRNKTDTACRITHIPTGITTQSQQFKSQTQNRKEAFINLAEKLKPMMTNRAKKERFSAGNIRVRNYNQKTQRVIDSRLPGEIFNYDDVLEGDGLNKIITRLQKQGNIKDE